MDTDFQVTETDQKVQRDVTCILRDTMILSLCVCQRFRYHDDIPWQSMWCVQIDCRTARYASRTKYDAIQNAEGYINPKSVPEETRAKTCDTPTIKFSI